MLHRQLEENFCEHYFGFRAVPCDVNPFENVDSPECTRVNNFFDSTMF